MGDSDSTYEKFIDADSGFSNEKDSYETIILRQIQECVRILSKEMTGGQVMYRNGPNGSEKYIEDVREMVINSVDTLRMLLTSYIKGNNKQMIEDIYKDISDYKKKVHAAEIIVPGKGAVRLGDMKGIHVDHPAWKEFVHYKAMKHRELFEVLICCYNSNKAEIKKLEEE